MNGPLDAFNAEEFAALAPHASEAAREAVAHMERQLGRPLIAKELHAFATTFRAIAGFVDLLADELATAPCVGALGELCERPREPGSSFCAACARALYDAEVSR